MKTTLARTALLTLSIACGGPADEAGPPVEAVSGPGTQADLEPDTATGAPAVASDAEPPDAEPPEAPRTAEAPRTGQSPEPALPEQPEPELDPFEGWSTYRHPLGSELRHPPDWRVQATPTGLVLLPPDADLLRESITGTAGDSDGLTDPASARAGRQLDALVQQLSPGARRTAGPERVDAADVRGAAYEYANRLPDGTRVRAKAWIAIWGDVAAGLSLAATEDLFRRREPTVERIFSSIRDTRGAGDQTDGRAPSPGDYDRRLIGRFRGESLSTGDGIYVNTQLYWSFLADGTVLYGGQSFLDAHERDHDGNLEWSAGGSTDRTASRGRWSAKDGLLDLRWDDGSASRFAFGFEPDGSLVFRHPVTRKLVNFYAPVR